MLSYYVSFYQDAQEKYKFIQKYKNNLYLFFKGNMIAADSIRISLVLAEGRRFWKHLKILLIALDALTGIMSTGEFGGAMIYPESKPEGYAILSIAAFNSCEKLIK